MNQEIHASIRVELLDHPGQTATIIADVAKAWATMLEAIGLEIEATFTINETRSTKPKGKRKKAAQDHTDPDELRRQMAFQRADLSKEPTP